MKFGKGNEDVASSMFNVILSDDEFDVAHTLTVRTNLV